MLAKLAIVALMDDANNRSIDEQLAARGLRSTTFEAGWYVTVTDPRTGEAVKVWATDLPLVKREGGAS